MGIDTFRAGWPWAVVLVAVLLALLLVPRVRAIARRAASAARGLAALFLHFLARILFRLYSRSIAQATVALAGLVATGLVAFITVYPAALEAMDKLDTRLRIAICAVAIIPQVLQAGLWLPVIRWFLPWFCEVWLDSLAGADRELVLRSGEGNSSGSSERRLRQKFLDSHFPDDPLRAEASKALQDVVERRGNLPLKVGDQR